MAGEKRYGLFIDTTRCTGCRACQVACKQWNQLPGRETRFEGSYENPPRLLGESWTRVQFVENKEGDKVRFLFRKIQCMHCTEASCMAVCPVGAIERKNGAVVNNRDKCIGCKYCVMACPFKAMQFNEEWGTSAKCIMCMNRVEEGLTPACAKACPPGAVNFGEREEMLALARTRQKERQEKGLPAYLYGEKELGGLGAIYLLDARPEVYGLPVDPRPANANFFAKWAAAAAAAGLVAVAPLYLFFRRREEGIKQEHREVDHHVSG